MRRSVFFGFMAGVISVILMLIVTDSTPLAVHREWRRCGQDRAAYSSDSAFYRLRPECRWWSEDSLKAVKP